MSRSSAEPVVCPRCGNASVTDLWEWINVSLDPGLRDEVVSGEINRFECSDCGFEAQIERPLLYVDPVRSLVVYAAPREARDDPAAIAEAEADARRRFQAVAAEAGQAVPEAIGPIPIAFGYPALARRVLQADALEALEDVLSPDTPDVAPSIAAAEQLEHWRAFLAAPDEAALAGAVRARRAAIRMPLLIALVSAIGRAARAGDRYLAGFLTELGDAVLAAATGAADAPA